MILPPILLIMGPKSWIKYWRCWWRRTPSGAPWRTTRSILNLCGCRSSRATSSGISIRSNVRPKAARQRPLIPRCHLAVKMLMLNTPQSYKIHKRIPLQSSIPLKLAESNGIRSQQRCGNSSLMKRRSLPSRSRSTPSSMARKSWNSTSVTWLILILMEPRNLQRSLRL